ncbi:DegV family protein [Candidatus Mycoplasma mahonii]|uniref:DegV family protein n=1 Tax=Candidatus Mycoplasma mahonii TaxID=3004105 RepID=UPI0026F22779|nr:DegV family protein [Candidatus Mycoplasma mahonii]WKX02688.1 DegV family protein [Candidatus Mycoplasma mahonii]
MKLGIIVDSSCGLTKDQVEKRGWIFMPLSLTIDGKEYIDGVDIEPETFYSKITPESKVKTACTSPGIITKILKDHVKKYDHIIVYAISINLSSQTSNISMAAKDFKNVDVIQSKGVGNMIVKNCEEIEKHANNGAKIDELLALGEKMSNNLHGLVVPQYMDWLVSGGRISPAAAKMAGMLKIIPIIELKDGKLDKYGKGRSFRKTLKKSAQALLKEDGRDENVEWLIYNARNEEIDSIKLDIEKIVGRKINVYSFPPIVGVHVGKGAVAIVTYKNL